MASIGLEPILREEMDFESIASANSAKRPQLRLLAGAGIMAEFLLDDKLVRFTLQAFGIGGLRAVPVAQKPREARRKPNP